MEIPDDAPGHVKMCLLYFVKNKGADCSAPSLFVYKFGMIYLVPVAETGLRDLTARPVTCIVIFLWWGLRDLRVCLGHTACT